jgi:hypothetical protein
MSHSIAARRAHREVPSGDLPLIGAVPVSHQAVTLGDELVGGDWILPLVKNAQERVMSQKEAVLTMGMDKSQYIRNLNSDGHLSIRRMGMLGESFWRELFGEVSSHFGWDDEAAQLERAIEVQRAAAAQIERLSRKLVSR